MKTFHIARSEDGWGEVIKGGSHRLQPDEARIPNFGSDNYTRRAIQIHERAIHAVFGKGVRHRAHILYSPELKQLFLFPVVTGGDSAYTVSKYSSQNKFYQGCFGAAFQSGRFKLLAVPNKVLVISGLVSRPLKETVLGVPFEPRS